MQQPMLSEYLLQNVGTYLEPRSASIFRNLNKHHRTVLFPTLVKLLVQSTFGRWRGTRPATPKLKPLLQIAGVGNEHVIAEVAA